MGNHLHNDLFLRKGGLVAVSAHNGLTAKLVDEAGFDAVWVSGFEVAATHGLPDNGTITMTEMRDIVREIADQTDLPLIVDCDEGYGGIHNAKRTAKEMLNAGASAICIEDNLFPKKHSFWAKGQKLAKKEQHGAKIKLIKKCCGSDLMVIGRTEALIRGLGMANAIRRAEYYSSCGADMILIHSRDESGKEARDIPRAWAKRTPLMIVPTKFPFMTTTELHQMGYSVVVWANHTLRLSLKAVREGLAELKASENAADIEARLGSLEDIYSLTGVKEMEKDECK